MNTAISLQLFQIDLSYPSVDYEAISYTWGDNSDTQVIEIDGQSYRIRSNLWDFLLHLRKRKTPRTLWADAICIDQNDPIEKGHQVSVIGQIFQKASKVLIWLGEAADGSDAVMKVLTHGLTKRPAFARWVDKLKNTPERPRMYKFKRRWEDNLKDWDFTHHFLLLCQRPYWTRTWVVQEIVLAKELVVHCGSYFVTWDQFSNSIITLTDHLRFSHRGAVNIVNNGPGTLREERLSRKRRFSSSRSLHETLWVFRRTQCTDLRDKIYALLSMSNSDSGQTQLAVDYTISTMELFFRTFEHCYESYVRERKISTLGSIIRPVLQLDSAEVQRELAQRPDFLRRVGCTTNDVTGFFAEGGKF